MAENVIDPTHHPCLAALPAIFLKAMKGISAMVDAYLGRAKKKKLPPTFPHKIFACEWQADYGP